MPHTPSTKPWLPFYVDTSNLDQGVRVDFNIDDDLQSPLSISSSCSNTVSSQSHIGCETGLGTPSSYISISPQASVADFNNHPVEHIRDRFLSYNNTQDVDKDDVALKSILRYIRSPLKLGRRQPSFRVSEALVRDRISHNSVLQIFGDVKLDVFLRFSKHIRDQPDLFRLRTRQGRAY
jgi:hypothetical protein